MTVPLQVPFLEVCDIEGGTQPPKSTFLDQAADGYVRLLQIQDFKSDKKAVYIGCPPMLLWLAEAAGVSRKALLSAKRSALTSSRKRISNCAAIRNEIPWSVVEERLRGRSLS